MELTLSDKKGWWVRCDVCNTALKEWAGSTPCCGSLAWVVSDEEAEELNRLNDALGGGE